MTHMRLAVKLGYYFSIILSKPTWRPNPLIKYTENFCLHYNASLLLISTYCLLEGFYSEGDKA